MKDLHVVLGANGGVGKQLVHLLQSKGAEYRAVARSIDDSKSQNLRADLLQLNEAEKTTESAKVVYLCVGLPYDRKIWAQQWPIVIENVISACEKSKSKLIFLDNVYMYGPVLKRPFDESHPQETCTAKGKIRKDIALQLLKAHEEKRIELCIARAADFFGPDATNSILYQSFLDRMLAGKSPQLLFPINITHTYANTEDIARALFTLSNAHDVWGEVWHLPVGDPITIGEMGSLFNEELGKMYQLKEAPGYLRKVFGLFIGPLKELEEMRYQFENPYVMSWEKFGNRFPDFKRTEYPEVIRNMIASFKR